MGVPFRRLGGGLDARAPQVDEYIRTGAGDLRRADEPDERRSGSPREVADVLRWLRDYNAGARRQGAVRRRRVLPHAPRWPTTPSTPTSPRPLRRGLRELRRHLRVIRPATSNMYEYIEWYVSVADKQPYIRHARQVYALVDGLPHRPGDRAHALALHHARQIVSFYEHYSLPDSDSFAYRDARAAENLRWWRELQRRQDRLLGGQPAHRQRPAAAHRRAARRRHALRQRRLVPAPLVRPAVPVDRLHLRPRHGEPRAGQTADLPPPAPDWFERPFGAVGLDQFALDLRAPAPPPVRRWLQAPITTRGSPIAARTRSWTGGTLAQWFDVIVHRQRVTPTSP